MARTVTRRASKTAAARKAREAPPVEDYIEEEDEFEEDEDIEVDEVEDEEDEDDAPRSRRRASRGDSKKSNVGSGWDSYRKRKKERSDWPDNFWPSEDDAIIKFLDDEPFAVFHQHWFNELSGKKSFVCIEDDCPLCDIGDRPSIQNMFNVLVLDEDSVETRVWTTGVRLATLLENLATDKKKGPLTKGYWSVSKAGTGSKASYSVSPVKERDLEEDWNIVPLTDEELDEVGASRYDASIVQENTRRELKAIAAKLNEDD